MNRICAALALFVLAFPSLAQTPADDWRTITTPHFRLHYPAAYEAWSLRAASRLESIREAVVAETGFDPKPVTDILVVNPLAQANGITIPLLDTPRIVLFAEPAGPGDVISDYGSWIDLLVVHEMTHMVHLVRPSRNPMERALEHVLPIGPLALAAPRWVTEGYATVVEGRLTGFGRPSSTIRAAILRKWAQSGRLPTYAQLQSDQRFLGMSMAYLVGSAYLEWLEERSGAGSLRKLWPRMAARHRRTFDEAFEGIFGDSPEKLYGIFTAELTERAVSVDRETRGELREGALWQETTRNSGDPAVSPDGKEIAVVLRSRSTPSRLVIWSTAAPAEEEKKYEKQLSRILKKDPEDVAPLRSKPLPRKSVHELTLPDGGDIESPRWTSDGRSIVFTHRMPDRNGDLHHDLFRWTPATGAVVRLTTLADVGDADPIGDSGKAVAVRTRDGASQLVEVALAGGDVTPITEPSIDRVYSHPRVSADGRRVAYAAHESGAWHLVVRDRKTGAERVFPTAARVNVASPEWSPAGDRIFAAEFSGGFIDIHQFDPDGTAIPVTRTSGAATEPAPSTDGRLFFMSLEPDGYTLRVLDKVAPAPSREAFTRSLVPALPPAPAAPAAFEARQTPPPRRYGIGRQEPQWVANGTDAPSAHTFEVGIRLGDVVGRLDTLAVASLGTATSQRGASIGSAWRGWPVTIAAQLYGMKEADARQSGLELRTSWAARGDLTAFDVEAGALGSRVKPLPRADSLRRDLAFASASLRGRRFFGETSVDGSATLAAEAGDAPHRRAILTAGIKTGDVRFGGRAEVDRAGGEEPVTLGGIATTIVPLSAIANRVLEPALPTATLSGRRYTGLQADATLGGATFFYRQHRLDQRLRLAGIEFAQAIPPMPIVKTTAMQLTIGAARILDEPLRNRTRYWIGVRLEP